MNTDSVGPELTPGCFAIIGGGCSGTLVAAQLLRNAPPGSRVILIERDPPVGKGVAYRTDASGHVLNVQACGMSAWPDDPGHFLRWARDRSGHLGYPDSVDPGDYLPRWMFGQYLSDVLMESKSAAPGISLEIVIGEAVNIEETGRIREIVLRDGRRIQADCVVLALGILPGEYPIKRPLPFYRGSRYLHSPLLPAAIGGVAKDDDLLIVGAGLTALDIVVECRSLGHRGTIHSLSRRGLRPLPHRAPCKAYPPFLTADALPPTVLKTVQVVRAEVRRAAASGVDWRAVVDALRPVTQLLWRAYPPEERSRFMRHLRPYWEVHRHRISPSTASIVQEAEADGHLKFYAGRLSGLNETPGGAEALIKLRGREEVLFLLVAKVINCTGPRTDYSKYQHPLLINLLAAGLVGHDPLALGIDAAANGEVFRCGKNPSGWLYTIGAPLKGVLWESTAVAEIRAQAAGIAECLTGHSLS